LANDKEPEDIFRESPPWSYESYGNRCFHYDVFISHAKGDESAELAEALTRHGLRVWYDKYQDMNDAQYSTRIVWGLRGSRSLLCAIGSPSIERHTWIRGEVSAAQVAAHAAGVGRVFLALMNPEHTVPAWLSDYPIVLRYKAGTLTDDVLQPLVSLFRQLNHVTIKTIPLPLSQLLQRAKAVRASRRHPLPHVNDTAFERVQELTARALEIVGEAEAPEKINVMMLGDVFFRVRSATDRLQPSPERGMIDVDERAMCRLVDDLYLLLSLPGIHNDTRGALYLALQQIAGVGVVHAFKALRECLHWEFGSWPMVSMIADFLAKYPQHRGRDEAVLTLLKSEFIHDPWPLSLLQEGDEAVLVKYHSRELTAPELGKHLALEPSKRPEELMDQIKVAVATKNVLLAEVVMRNASSLSGICRQASNLIKINTSAHYLKPPKRFPGLCYNV
jgi:hypothetical protein